MDLSMDKVKVLLKFTSTGFDFGKRLDFLIN